MEVTVLLHPRRPVRPFVRQLRRSPLKGRRHLTHPEFTERFGATPDAVRAVREFARNNRLHVISADRARRSVVLGGTAAELSAAFAVGLDLWRTPEGVYHVQRGPVYVPRWLRPMVAGVFGFDGRPQATPRFRFGRTIPKPQADGAPGSFTAPQLAELYGFPDGDGAGQTIGIIELGGGYRRSDLNAYFSSLGLDVPEITEVSVNGAVNQPTGDPTSADAEVGIDLQVAGAIAPGSRFVVYFAPNTDRGFLDAVTTAIHDRQHRPSIISIGWGSAETHWSAQALRAIDQAFACAAALGVTVFSAAGDGGSSDGMAGRRAHADFPASSPHQLGCGGTTLRRYSEVAWPAGGGGVSDVFQVPPYQRRLRPRSANPPYRSGRGVPDLSAASDPATGYRVFVHGSHRVFGGTSPVAPLWAGLTALLQQALDQRVAPAHPLLYGRPGVFRDISVGSNGAYFAGRGWDPCTGLGTPNGTAILEAIREAQAIENVDHALEEQVAAAEVIEEQLPEPRTRARGRPTTRGARRPSKS